MGDGFTGTVLRGSFDIEGGGREGTGNLYMEEVEEISLGGEERPELRSVDIILCCMRFCRIGAWG